MDNATIWSLAAARMLLTLCAWPAALPGESEAKLRRLFADAAACAPCIVFIGAPSP